jgi:hypothetical protein
MLERTIDDIFGDRFFTGQHQHVYKFSDIDIAKFRIRQNFSFGDFATTWHYFSFRSSSVGFGLRRTPRTTIKIVHLLDHFGQFKLRLSPQTRVLQVKNYLLIT